MNPLLLNAALALIWSAMMGAFSAPNLAIGFLLGYFILNMQQTIVGRSTYYRKVNRFVTFMAFFLASIVLASVRVAGAVLFPNRYVRPGIVAVPLDTQTGLEAVMLACAVSLTPGTVSIDISEDKTTLFVHCMTVDHPDRIRRDIKEGLERRLLELMR